MCESWKHTPQLPFLNLLDMTHESHSCFFAPNGALASENFPGRRASPNICAGALPAGLASLARPKHRAFQHPRRRTRSPWESTFLLCNLCTVSEPVCSWRLLARMGVPRKRPQFNQFAMLGATWYPDHHSRPTATQAEACRVGWSKATVARI